MCEEAPWWNQSGKKRGWCQAFILRIVLILSVFDLRSNTEVRGLRVLLLNQGNCKFTV